jgi:hypothetical protein
MDGQEPENLKELLEKLFDAEQVESCLDDFRKAERLFHDHPAPEPDDMLIANIKAEIAMRLPARRVKIFRRRLWEAASIAATLGVVALVGVRLSHEPGRQTENYASLIPTAIWESNNIAADDADLARFTTEIDQIKDEVSALDSGEQAVDAAGTVTDLEADLVEINSDFWKE